MLSTLHKIFSWQHTEIFFLFFQENGFWIFMLKITSLGDKLHERSKPISGENTINILTLILWNAHIYMLSGRRPIWEHLQKQGPYFSFRLSDRGENVGYHKPSFKVNRCNNSPKSNKFHQFYFFSFFLSHPILSNRHLCKPSQLYLNNFRW